MAGRQRRRLGLGKFLSLSIAIGAKLNRSSSEQFATADVLCVFFSRQFAIALLSALGFVLAPLVSSYLQMLYTG